METNLGLVKTFLPTCMSSILLLSFQENKDEHKLRIYDYIPNERALKTTPHDLDLMMCKAPRHVPYVPPWFMWEPEICSAVLSATTVAPHEQSLSKNHRVIDPIYVYNVANHPYVSQLLQQVSEAQVRSLIRIHSHWYGS